jgi:hypothetical protein
LQGVQGPIGPQGPIGETGPRGEPGIQGEPGKDYVLTEEDKEEIASNISLDDYAKKDYVDEAIANIDIPEGEIVDEVYVGTTAPTDENIKIWINPEEELEFATKAYVDEAVAGAGGSGSSAYVFEGYLHGGLNSFSDADKAKFIEIYTSYTNNNKYDGGELWLRTGSSTTCYYKVISIELYVTSSTRRLSLVTSSPIRDTLHVNFTTSGTPDKTSTSSQPNVAKDWRWGGDLYGMNSYSHIKIVGYFDGNASNITSFDISTSNNNYFSEEGGTYYHCVWSYQDEVNTIVFYNNWGDVQVSEFNSDQGHSFDPLGYWYWG